MPEVKISCATSIQAYDQEKPLTGSSLSAAAANQLEMGPKLVNAIIHKTVDGEYTVTQRPKLVREVAAPASPTTTEYVGQGIHYLPDNTQIRIIDGTLYKNGTSITGALPTGVVAYFANYEPDKCGIKIGDEFWTFNSGTDTLTEVTDGWDDDAEIDTEVPVEGLVYLDDYMFVLDEDGRMYNSNLGSFGIWDSSTDSIQAERNADMGKACFRHIDHIGILSQLTLEFFYDAANSAGTPLARRADIFHTVGTPDGKSLATLRDTACFIGQDEGGNYSIYTVNKYKVTKVSDSMADLALRNAVVSSNSMVGTMFSAGGKDFYSITFLHSNSTTSSTLDQRFRSYVFDLNDKVLMEWDTNLTTKGFMPVSVAKPDAGELRIMNYTGDVFKLSVDTIAQDEDTTDSSTDTIDLLIRTYPIDLATSKRKFWGNFAVNGYHAQDTAANGLDLSIRWSDTLGKDWGTSRTETLTNEQRAEIDGLGESRHRVWEVSTSSPVRAYLQNFIIDVEGGSD